MYQGDCPLIQLFLVEELVLDSVEVHERAHARAGVPTDVGCVDIDFSEHLNHFILVAGIRFRSRCGCSKIAYFLMAILRDIHSREREAIRDLKDAVLVHAHQRARRGGWEGLGAVFDDLHDHKGLHLDGPENSRVSHIVRGEGVGLGRVEVAKFGVGFHFWRSAPQPWAFQPCSLAAPPNVKEPLQAFPDFTSSLPNSFRPLAYLCQLETKMADSPVCIVCVGMAGSGKTTFMQRINSYLHQKRTPPYVMNLDPAVLNVPFESNIDIRDSINYKEVMRQYKLGPNGGILTSLNLFATKIDQILALLEKRTTPPEDPSQKQIKHILIDTPGQIEVFVWSASGDILLGSLASSFPTVIAYIIDTPRTASTSTFMSNMLYACSILYKTKLPMILVFNKIDVKDASFAKEWMTDFEAFQAALQNEEEVGIFGGGEGTGQGSGYMSSLLHSMSLVLEEFYNHLKVVGVSAARGDGIDEFFEAVKEKKEEFERDYKPELEKRRQEREQMKQTKREKDLGRLLSDLNIENAAKRRPREQEPETISDLEDVDEDEDGQGMVSPDEDDDEDHNADDGLSKRYQQALKDSADEPSAEDKTFANYIRSTNIG